MENQVIQGDSLDQLKKLPDNCIDSIVTDPPYHLVSIVKRYGKEGSKEAKIENTDGSFNRLSKGFMGKQWDGVDESGIGIAQNVELWKECLRVLKPGGHLLAFSGTRTYHRMASAIEDAGFEVRDMIEWVYGSGFPKSLNIGKAVDKLQGNEREIVREEKEPLRQGGNVNWDMRSSSSRELSRGTSEWEGWGTALKPAHEPICMARKPLAEKTVAENCLKWGTGGINIDESRVSHNEEVKTTNRTPRTDDVFATSGFKKETNHIASAAPEGRFPTNLIHDNSEEVRECFPDSNGSQTTKVGKTYGETDGRSYLQTKPHGVNINDKGSASRFFKSIIYQAKASKSERNKGCEGLEETYKKRIWAQSELSKTDFGEQINKHPTTNNHPTVKPIALMEYLIKMVTPKDGIVLDPFAGSGTTGLACKNLNRNYILIEKEPEYIEIIKARLGAID